MENHELDLFDCPICHGAGLLEEESGWCLYVSCLDCGCRTAEVPFHSEKEKEEAMRRAVHMWNIGKVIAMGPGE